MRAPKIALLAMAAALIASSGSSSTVEAHKKKDLYKEGAVKDQWMTLFDGGCDVAKANIATPIEARVLRNTPYALKGKIFKSAELTELFGDDGDWYKPSTKKPEMTKAEARCIGKLSKWEKRLRKQLPLKKKVEAFMTRDRRLYLDLRDAVPFDAEYYTDSGGRTSGGATYWGFSYNKKCHKNGDCGGYSIDCELDKKTRKVKCMLIAAG